MIYDFLQEKINIKSKKKLIIGMILILAVILLYFAVNFKFDLIQYEEVGRQFTDIIWINTFAGLISMLTSFCFIFSLFIITNRIIIKRLKCFFIEENIQPKRLPNFSLAFVIAVIGAFVTKDVLYQNALSFLNSEMFNTAIKVDPIFGKNFGYYLFQRPFFVAVSDYISGVILVIAIYTIAYYVLAFGSIFSAIETKSLKKYGVVLHNLINIALFFLIKVFTYGFSAENILYSKHARFLGAGYTGVNIWLKIYSVAPFVLAVAVILSFIFFIRNKMKNGIITILIFPAFWIAGMIIASVVQVVWVMPNEITREKNYIRNNIELTRFAYNLSDKLQTKEFNISESLTPQLLEKNKEMIDNLMVIDSSTMLDTQNQFQSIRGHYRFKDTDIQTYNINGKPENVYISAREIDIKNLDEKSYENLRLKYTHGYGIVINPVNRVNNDGYADFIVKDVPVQSAKGIPEITRPEIYFGELTNEYAVVNVKKAKEIDYPQKESNVETVYSGKAGVKLTPFNKVIAAAKLGDLHMLFSRDMTSDSKVLINRNIIKRAKLVAPFLDMKDEDAYIVINKEGRLFWVIDAYTESPYFPYSQPITLDKEKKKKINYIRNSVKVIVDAYDGTTRFYIVDTRDPIVMTYKKIYPNLFERGAMPEDIVSHLRYPKRLFKIQAEILKKYHTIDESRFFSGKDIWEIPASQQKDKRTDMEPYYIMMKLPDSSKPEPIIMLPFTSNDGSTMTGLISARTDIFSKMTLYQFPRTRLLYGPREINLNIDKDQDITKTFNLWRQSGASIIQGDLLAVPLEDGNNKSLIYVKSVYISGDGGSTAQELKKIIVGYQRRVVMEDTLNKALKKMVLLAPFQDSIIPETSGNKDLVESLLKVYEEMKAFSSSNDWEEFGKKMKELDEIISEIKKRKDEI